MGRKNAASNPNSLGPPVEQYRKQIGKQDWKKNKSSLKEESKKKDAKSLAMTIYDILLMLLAFLVVIGAVYLLFYWLTMSQPVADIR